MQNSLCRAPKERALNQVVDLEDPLCAIGAREMLRRAFLLELIIPGEVTYIRDVCWSRGRLCVGELPVALARR